MLSKPFVPARLREGSDAGAPGTLVVKEDGAYATHQDLRKMCIFSTHNVIKGVPFPAST